MTGVSRGRLQVRERRSAAKVMLCVALGCVAAGLVLWRTPYEQLAGSTPVRAWVIAGVIAGCAVGLLTRQWAFAIVATGVLVAVGFVIATLGRVVFDTLSDPTRHNLWPFEVLFAAGVGFASGLAGALAQWMIRAVIRIVARRGRR